MAKITNKTIRKQLKYDLIGKDSQRGITLTYGWLANQFGHFALGFIPTILFYLLLSNYFPQTNAFIWSPLITAIMWTCFEAYNFLGPLLKQSKTDTFQPDWKNVGFDTITDLMYFYTGAFTAAVIKCQALYIQIPLYILIITIALLFKYWYPVKMYMQYSFFPFQFRISQWQHSLNEKDKNEVLELINKKEKKHFLIFGDENSGKTSLGVGIATEFSIKRSVAFYTTAIKFTKLLQNSDDSLKKNFQLEWSWRQSEILVIDDIAAGGDVETIIKPSFFEDVNNSSEFKDSNLSALQNKSVMWIVGKESNKEIWTQYLINIGINKNNIIPILLKK